MKRLGDILYRCGSAEIHGDRETVVKKVCFDSREVRKGALFVALKGAGTDGHRYIAEAVKKGAVAVVGEKLPANLKKGVTYIKVKDSHLAIGEIAANFYDHPSRKLKLVGVTGTNGKTTVATLLYQLFTRFGYKSGLLSTIQNFIAFKSLPSTHTTPDPVHINGLLDRMVRQGCSYCFIEVSSHALSQRRVAGLYFAMGIFTNLTHDHLDYHKTFTGYLNAKKSFFDMLPSDAVALVNNDDRNASVMVQNTGATVKSYALKSPADFRCKVIEQQLSGVLFRIGNREVWSKLTGIFNACNLLAVFAAACLLGMNSQATLRLISDLEPVEGRLEHIRGKQGITGIVDYAHTPDALEQVLKAIANLCAGNKNLLTVIGCGGDRDREKRPKMARIAYENSDLVILTSDNPRSEKPEDIIEEMKQGIKPSGRRIVLSIPDRRTAIKTACAMAHDGDIVLVAGKGHEKTQEIQGKRYPFYDKQVLTECLNV